MKESARADSPVWLIPGSCVQSFEQYEIAGHVADAFSVVWIFFEVAEFVTPAGVVAEPSEVAGQDVEFPDDGIMDFGSSAVDRSFFFRGHHLPLHPSLCFVEDELEKQCLSNLRKPQGGCRTSLSPVGWSGSA